MINICKDLNGIQEHKEPMYKDLCFTFKKILLIHIIFFNSFSYSQNKEVNVKMKYGSIITVKLGATVVLEDGLSIWLKSFSHKTSIHDNISKASAYIVLSLRDEETDEFLSVYGDDHLKSEEELNSFEYTRTVEGTDGFTYTTTTRNHHRFIFWKDYKIQLKEFEYDEFIKILVTVPPK
ncbi:hypothetical protein [Aquimarina sp. SS2-1]|uniref:hypothetical protein n=1 Tax=Aquimarina besae TaxID=3342247 RepID=UPI003672A91B